MKVLILATGSDELKEIKEKNIFEQIGKTGKGTYYIIKGEQRGKMKNAIWVGDVT